MSVLLAPAPTHPAGALDRSELAELVARLAADPSSWQGQVRHLSERRWWTRLARESGADVWLISWPSLQHTELHDHGASAAALTVVEGELDHVLASRSGDLSHESISPGTLLTVEPWAVHDVRNASNAAAVSIHAYSPPLEQMTFYDRRPGGLEVVRTVRGDEPEIEQPW